MDNMDDNSLPSDVQECHRLLLAAFKQASQLEQQAAVAEQQATIAEQRASRAEQLAAQAEQLAHQSRQEVTELKQVLDETAASFEQLRHEHTASLEELAWYKRWVHGRRSERLVEGEGQGHLFDLSVDDQAELPASGCEPPQQHVAAHSRRSRRRELDLSGLPHFRH